MHLTFLLLCSILNIILDLLQFYHDKVLQIDRFAHMVVSFVFFRWYSLVLGITDWSSSFEGYECLHRIELNLSGVLSFTFII